MHVTAIVLAAGSAVRMKADKLALMYKGQRLLDRALTPLLSARSVSAIVVVVHPDFRIPLDRARCTVVVNPDHARGMSTSLRAGVAAAPDHTNAFMIALADMPEITMPLVESLIDAFRQTDKDILVPNRAGSNGHPVLFDRKYEDELRALQGDVGAKAIIRRHASSVERFPTDDRAVLFDIDTPESIARRQIHFTDARALEQAQNTLRDAGIWFLTSQPRVDAAGGDAPLALEYHAFDQEKVLALCRDVGCLETPCKRKC